MLIPDIKIEIWKINRKFSDFSILALDCIAQSSSAINVQCRNVNYQVTTNDWKSWEVFKKYLFVSTAENPLGWFSQTS